MKLTIIYNEYWMSGSHRHCLTHMKYVEKLGDESFSELLAREEIEDTQVVFIFYGHVEHFRS